MFRAFHKQAPQRTKRRSFYGNEAPPDSDRPPPSSAAHACGEGTVRGIFFALRLLNLRIRPQWGRLAACGGLTPRGESRFAVYRAGTTAKSKQATGESGYSASARAREPRIPPSGPRYSAASKTAHAYFSAGIVISISAFPIASMGISKGSPNFKSASPRRTRAFAVRPV